MVMSYEWTVVFADILANCNSYAINTATLLRWFSLIWLKIFPNCQKNAQINAQPLAAITAPTWTPQLNKTNVYPFSHNHESGKSP